MDQALTERIRERAYHIWFATGRHDGQAEQHWLVAEREILQTAKAAAIPATRNIAKKVSRPLGRATKSASIAN